MLPTTYIITDNYKISTRVRLLCLLFSGKETEAQGDRCKCLTQCPAAAKWHGRGPRSWGHVAPNLDSCHHTRLPEAGTQPYAVTQTCVILCQRHSSLSLGTEVVTTWLLGEILVVFCGILCLKVTQQIRETSPVSPSLGSSKAVLWPPDAEIWLFPDSKSLHHPPFPSGLHSPHMCQMLQKTNPLCWFSKP